MATDIRTSGADINYLSISNGITNLNPEATLDQSKAIIGGPVPDALNPTNYKAYASLLKLSDWTANLPAVLNFSIIDQGQENCVDINNHVSVVRIFSSVYGRTGDSGNQTFSIKGGCDSITIVGTIYSNNKIDYVVGRWSDQSQNVDTNLWLGALRVDGDATVIIGRGLIGYLFGNKNKITLTAGVKFLFWRSVLEWGYWWGKWAAVKTIYKWFPSLDK